jgi:hypothetical protein
MLEKDFHYKMGPVAKAVRLTDKSDTAKVNTPSEV